MPGLGTIASSEYQQCVDEMILGYPDLADVIDALEWELTRAEHFTVYPVIGQNRDGNIHYIKSEDTPVIPEQVIIVFGFDSTATTTKVLLMAAKIAERDGEMATPDEEAA